MRIRPYETGDLAAVVALWEACGLIRPWNDPATDIAFCLGTPQAGLLVGVEGRDGQVGAAPSTAPSVIGTVMVGHDGHRGWIYYLAVSPNRQGAGLGSLLMEQAEAWLKARGVPKLQLMVRSTNTQALGFYERLGYRTEPVATLSKWLRPPPVEPDGR